jgi:hypothetical protein
MTWNATAQTVRCRGRILRGHRAGKPVLGACRTVIFVGAWFWLAGKRPHCASCALDERQHEDADLAERRRVLEHRHKLGPTFTDELLKRSEP